MSTSLLTENIDNVPVKKASIDEVASPLASDMSQVSADFPR